MLEKPDLTPDFCLHAIVNSTPKPGRWNPPTTAASTTTLFDLGVVDATTGQVFVQAVKEHLSPWQIDDTDVTCAPQTTLQAAVLSVQSNAF